MATFEKRAGHWRAKVRKKGRRLSATFPRLEQAREWAARIEAEATSSKYGMPLRRTLQDAIRAFLERVSHTRAGARWEKLRLQSLAARETDLCARQLSSLTEADFAAWRDKRLCDVSPATVRREIALLGAVLGVARREWRWLSHDPLKIKKPKEPPARRRGVSREEVIGILAHANEQVSCAFLLGIETGMRAGEILGLTWGHVDLDRRVVTLPKTKNGDSRQVPLSASAVAICDQLKPVELVGPVFHISPATLDAQFRAARVRAVSFCPSIATLRFHDSRSEAISRLSRKLDVLDLARVVGHRNLSSLMLYYKSSAEDLAKRLG